MNEDVRAALAALSLKQRKVEFRDKSFPHQDTFNIDPARFLAIQCSRRAGKTSGLALRFLRTLDKHPGCYCPYIALTLGSARNIMWPVLQELDEKFKVGLHFKEDLTATHPNGARLQLLGADTKGFIRKVKGIKTPGAAIDEAQDFGSHLESLVDDVLSPAMTDYEDSWLALAGTPGPVPRGYFYDITHGGKYGYSVHRWTLLDNPYLPNAARFLADLKAKRQWDEDNPTLKREWKNQWVKDPGSLLIQYDDAVSHYDILPSGRYSYILGIDIGLKDSDALAVLAWSDFSPNIYLVEEQTTSGQDITSLVEQIKEIGSRYDISKMVIDQGGLGAKIAEELRRRHHIPVHAADKARKMENVAFLNDNLRLGKFKARRDSRFAQDSQLVQIDWEKTTPDRLVVKSGFHSDIIDAVLYAFKESPAFNYSKPVNAPKPGSREWYAAQEDDMERNSADDALEEHETKSGLDTDWEKYV